MSKANRKNITSFGGPNPPVEIDIRGLRDLVAAAGRYSVDLLSACEALDIIGANYRQTDGAVDFMAKAMTRFAGDLKRCTDELRDMVGLDADRGAS